MQQQATLALGQLESRPLADKMRPDTWEHFEGLGALDQNLLRLLKSGQGRPPSLVLWGPPGCGKTTLARLIGQTFKVNFVQLSAVLGGVKEIREIVAEARNTLLPTLLFVDEIHRFNKSQQDAFLPHVEDGSIILIGATTENPSFYLNGALLSRARVVVLSAHSETALMRIVTRASEQSLVTFDEAAQKLLCSCAAGDARRLLNLLESIFQFIRAANKASAASIAVNAQELREYLKASKVLVYDRSGEEHYNMASAFIKSMRGSDPDAALFWGFRMIEAGEDPLFIIRRMIIFASEDIGNADPRAITLAVSTLQAFESVGLPEGKIPIAQCITYLASAPKSNRSYKAMGEVLEVIKENPRMPVPLHIRNAPTGLMKSLGYGSEYRYPHDFEGGVVKNEQYLPDELAGRRFYQPSDRGYEKMITERLALTKK